TLGNGLTGNRGYDAARRLLDETFLTATAQKVFQESLAWTPRSLKAAQSRGDLGGRGQIFAYDGAGRLLQEGKTAAPLSLVANNTVAQRSAFTALADASSFTYDKAQNLLAKVEKENGVAESVSLPLDGSGRNRPASIGNVPLEWDANGNLKRKGNLRFEYDYRNRLTRVTRDNAEVATYQYDAFNRRTGKTLGSETRATVWSGWQPVEEYRDDDLDQRRIYGLGLDEIVQLQVDIDGDGDADQSYAPLYDETGNLVVMTGNNGKPIERYEYTPYGERKIFVDNTPPAVEQVRVKGNAVWIELSEEIAADALAAAAPTLTNLASQQALEIAATQPVVTGRQARRRLVLALQGTPPAADTQVRLTIPAAALQDSFLNQPAQSYEVTFAWPGADAVVQDNKAIQLQRVAVRDGFLEIELSEEPALATTSAIQLDGAAVTWTLGDDRYTLRSATALPAGAHALAIGTALADLDGGTLAETFNANPSLTAGGGSAVFEAPDPRETPASTIGNPFGFQGLPIDPETGLMYVRNRYYDAEMGRFITTDPMGYVDGPSVYFFAGNSPANLSDPMGLCLGLNDEPCYVVADRWAAALKKKKQEWEVDGYGPGSIIANTAIGTSLDAVDTFVLDPMRAGQATGDAVGRDAGAVEITLAAVQDTGRVASLAGGAGIVVKAAGKGATLLRTGSAAAQDLTKVTQTGGRTVMQYLKELEEAEKAYEAIRNTDDVAAIAKNINMPEFRVRRIKEHLFERVHQLADGVKRFDADPPIAHAWQRLQKGTQTTDDLKLLEHELFESKFEGIFKTDYVTAHKAANRSGRHSGLENIEE
ncbi:MAG TPA: RHS repeat-associated core domain-containing protein, partial [Thermoanaerobaculia bacterium]